MTPLVFFFKFIFAPSNPSKIVAEAKQQHQTTTLECSPCPPSDLTYPCDSRTQVQVSREGGIGPVHRLHHKHTEMREKIQQLVHRAWPQNMLYVVLWTPWPNQHLPREEVESGGGSSPSPPSGACPSFSVRSGRERIDWRPSSSSFFAPSERTICAHILIAMQVRN